MVVELSYIDRTLVDPETMVAAAPDLLYPKYCEIHAENEPGAAVDMHINTVYDAGLRRYVIDTLSVRRTGPEVEVSGVVLRGLAVQEVLQRGFRPGAVKVHRADGDRMPFPISVDLAREIVRGGPSNDGSLRWLARIYSVAHAISLPPAKTVQEQLGLTTPNTAVWIRRARDRGHLPADQYGPAMNAEAFALTREVIDDDGPWIQ